MNDKTFYTALNDGRVMGMSSYQLMSIPNYTLLGEDLNQVLFDIKKSFTSLLTEFYQVTLGTDSAIELMWLSSPESNQTYTSSIKLFLITRITDINVEALNSRLHNVDKLIHFILEQKKFSIIQTDNPYPMYISSNPHLQEMKAVRKKEDIMYMQNGIFNSAYYYDIYNDVVPELDGLLNYMMNTENACVIIQLINVQYAQQEQLYLEQAVNNYSNLLNGISIPQYGFVRDGLAEMPLKTYDYYYQRLNHGIFTQNVIVLGRSNTTNTLASKVLVECTTKNNEGKIPRFEIIDISDTLLQFKNFFHLSPWLVSEKILQTNRLNIMYDRYNQHMYRLVSFVTPDEISAIFRFPIGSKNITAGLEIIEIDKRNKSYTKGILNTADIILGQLQNVIHQDNANIGFNLRDLTKHMMVVGTPGSGKSTFLVGLMDRLWKQHNIPFLVIEPAKTEYRSLIDSIPDLQIFSPGKNNVAPYILNPFVPPKNVPLEIYKSIIKSAFSVAFEMWTPLDQLFDETLNICYSDCGWIDETTIDEGKRVFTLSEFIEVYREVVASKSYTGEYKKQVEAAGVMRLQGLLEQNLNIFDNQNCVSIEDILTKPTIIELSNVKDIKQKSFIIALLLNNIYAYVEANLQNDGELKNVILLEEAHVLLSGDNVAVKTEGESANQAAVKLLSNMLAEIRSRGVGIVVADQSPRKVSSEVVANTNLKIVFRLVEAVDKNIIMNSTTMNNIQFDRLSKLRTGQALIYFDKLDDVEEIALDDYRLKNNISTDLSDASVKEKMHYWDDKQHLLIPYEECVYLPNCEKTCDFNCRSKSRIICDRIYRKSMNNVKTLEAFKQLYVRINSLIKTETLEVFDENTYEEIKNCVKVHFLRKVRFYSEVPISRMLCINTIKSLSKGAEKNE